jgi:hypothetical protein
VLGLFLTSRVLLWQFAQTSANICEAGLPASRFCARAASTGAIASTHQAATQDANRRLGDTIISCLSAAPENASVPGHLQPGRTEFD